MTRAASMVDVSLAGAGLELEEAVSRVLAPGARVVLAIATPALWDPLEVPAVVAWVRPPDGRRPARAGFAFQHSGPESVFATWEMLSALVFD